MLCAFLTKLLNCLDLNDPGTNHACSRNIFALFDLFTRWLKLSRIFNFVLLLLININHVIFVLVIFCLLSLLVCYMLFVSETQVQSNFILFYFSIQLGHVIETTDNVGGGGIDLIYHSIGSRYQNRSLSLSLWPHTILCWEQKKTRKRTRSLKYSISRYELCTGKHRIRWSKTIGRKGRSYTGRLLNCRYRLSIFVVNFTDCSA